MELPPVSVLALRARRTVRRSQFNISHKHVMIGISSNNAFELINPEMIIGKNIINTQGR